MSLPASIPESSAPSLAGVFCTGEVIAITTAGLTVRTESGLFGARRAAGCLLEPAIGDLVLAAGESRARVYVLSVLERSADGPARLNVEGDLELGASGCLSLHADAGLRLTTGAAALLAADELTLRGRHTQALFERLDAVGGEAHSTLGRVRLVANAIESVVERVLLAAKTSLRMVEGADQSRCGSSDHRATGTVKVHGRNVVTTASELVKADGAQIHLG